MAKTTETIGEFTMNILTSEQYADAKKNNQIDPNQLYFTPEKKLVVAVSQDEYESMKEAGTLDEDVLYVTPASESVTIPEATETTAGLMPPSAVTKLKGTSTLTRCIRPGPAACTRSPWTAWGMSPLFLPCRKATSPTWASRVPIRPTAWPRPTAMA